MNGSSRLPKKNELNPSTVEKLLTGGHYTIQHFGKLKVRYIENYFTPGTNGDQWCQLCRVVTFASHKHT